MRFSTRPPNGFVRPREMWTDPLSFGIDLGTATIVVTAVDAEKAPGLLGFSPLRGGAGRRGGQVRRGRGGGAGVGPRRRRALGQEIAEAASAYPPGVPEAEARACRYVLENAGVACRRLIDEVSAAQALLRLRDGAIVDVGGGSTGVGVVEDGELVSLSDMPGGGHHLDLILVRRVRLTIDVAEQRKRAGGREIASMLASRLRTDRGFRSASKLRRKRSSESTSSEAPCACPSAADIISRYLGIPTIGYPHSELVTPFGIAMS